MTVSATGAPVEVIPSAKMSKSKKNVVDPVDIVARFGADTARWFVMSDSPPERDVEWTASGAEAAHRHLARVWRMAAEINEAPEKGADDSELLRALHRCIADVTIGIETFAFNVAIAKLYAFTNTLAKSAASRGARREAMQTLAQLMAPMVPHLAEEIWRMLGGKGLVCDAEWPEADTALLTEDTMTLPIQVNGKRRSEIVVAKGRGARGGRGRGARRCRSGQGAGGPAAEEADRGPGENRQCGYLNSAAAPSLPGSSRWPAAATSR